MALFVSKPRGVYHAFRNAGTEDARSLEFHTPGGFEDYCDEYEQIVQSAMDEDEQIKARTELGERYGVVWHEERTPEIMARLGIGSKPHLGLFLYLPFLTVVRGM